MRNEIFLRVLDRASSFIPHDSIVRLRSILEEEFYHYNISPVCTEIVPSNNMVSKVKLFLAVKKLEGLSPKSIECYGRTLAKFCIAIQKEADKITDMDVRMYLAVQSNKNLKKNTLNNILAPIRTFFQWMEDERYIQRSPAKTIKTIKVEKKLREALSRRELEMIRDAAVTLRDKAMVEFFYSTGCRLDEIQQLKKSKVNWLNRSARVVGKGNIERDVYINERAALRLQLYFDSRSDSHDAIFVSDREPHERLGRRRIEAIFSELGKKAGIEKPVFPHLLRHTTATNMLRSGATLTDVQKVLGHSNPATTLIYTDIANESIQQSHRKYMAG
jgi:integrase/recombinase XerD